MTDSTAVRCSALCQLTPIERYARDAGDVSSSLTPREAVGSNRPKHCHHTCFIRPRSSQAAYSLRCVAPLELQYTLQRCSYRHPTAWPGMLMACLDKQTLGMYTHQQLPSQKHHTCTCHARTHAREMPCLHLAMAMHSTPGVAVLQVAARPTCKIVNET